MILCALDFETTGLDPKKDLVTEAGLVLWDTDDRQPVRIAGFLVQTDFLITEEITRLTGITKAMLDRHGVPRLQAWQAIARAAAVSDYMVAHNGNDFDRLFLLNWPGTAADEFPDRPWIDTKTDLPQEAYGRSSSMKYMACDHGFLYDGHRAVNDVLAMLKILDRYPLPAILERAKSPSIHVQALVDFDHNYLAKERGYHWKAETKAWVKGLKQVDLEKEAAEAKFDIRVLS